MSDFQLEHLDEKGGSAKKKKQGYKDRKDESIAMRIRKQSVSRERDLVLKLKIKSF